MKKQYRLRKTIGEHLEGDVFELCDGVKKFYRNMGLVARGNYDSDIMRLDFPVSFIENCPELFEPFEPKEFTESQVRSVVGEFVSRVITNENRVKIVVDEIINQLRNE